MTWKKINNSDSGDSTHFGGDDIDKISDLFSNVDVDDVTINSDWTFRSGKLNLRNPANTFSTNIVGGAVTADRTLNYPAITATDDLVAKTLAQTLTNKTLDLETNDIALRDFARVFKSGSTYYAVLNNGTIQSSSTTAPETVIQAALDNASFVYIAGDTYPFSGGFSGLSVTSSGKTIIGGKNVLLQVPQGYTGDLIKYEGSILGGGIYGCKMGEAGTPQKLWKAIHIKSTGSSAAIKHMRFDYIQIDAPGWMVYLENTTSGAFINSMEFNNIYGYYPIIGFEWVDAASNDGYLHNNYSHIDIQADSNTTYGFKNVMSRSPMFVGCHVQDMDTDDTQMLIHSSCADAIIIGGSLLDGGSAGLFTDNGTTTTIVARGRGIQSGRDLTMNDAKNIILGTGTGTKIGTSTSQKLGFFNKTPIVQKSANADTSGATLGQLETEVNEVKQLLRDYGLLA